MKIYRKPFIGMALILFGLWSIAGLALLNAPSEKAWAQEDAELQALLSRLQERFGSVKTLKAAYVRELVPKIPSQLQSQSLRAEGQISFKSPDKLRLLQQKPREEKLISNGVKVWWYQPEEKTVHIYPLKNYYTQVRPVVEFLSGLGGLEKHFTIRLEPAAPEGASYYDLVLKPKTPQADLNQILLRLSRKTLLPQQFTIINALGDGIQFRLSNIRLEEKLPDSLFQFTPPKGTKVVSQNP